MPICKQRENNLLIANWYDLPAAFCAYGIRLCRVCNGTHKATEGFYA